MTLTIDFIEDCFNKFNNLYFDGELKTPRFEIMNTKSLLGQFRWRGGNYTIRISKYFNRSVEDYQNTIIHEMIHEYIRQHGIKDTNRHHGRVFYAIADRINREGGWHIARTDNVDGLGLTNGGQTYHIAILKLSDCYFKIVINPKYLNSFLFRFDTNKSFFKDYVVFTSTDDKQYCGYTACRKSIRGRNTTQDEFESMKALYKKVG